MTTRRTGGSDDVWRIYLADVTRRPMIDHNDLLVLFQAYQEGDMKARDRIAEANLRLVISIALKWQATGVEMSDLVQMGSLGLLRAIEKFRPEKGFRFSTYATWWIRQAIQRGVSNTADTIRIPIHARRDARETGADLPVADQSVDDPLNDEGDMFLRDFMADEDLIPADDAFADRDLQSIVHAVLDEMDDQGCVDAREAEVLRLRYGLGDQGEPQTLDDVGEILGVTRERIRQIEMLAKKHFRRQLRFSRPRLLAAVLDQLELPPDD